MQNGSRKRGKAESREKREGKKLHAQRLPPPCARPFSVFLSALCSSPFTFQSPHVVGFCILSEIRSFNQWGWETERGCIWFMVLWFMVYGTGT